MSATRTGRVAVRTIDAAVHGEIYNAMVNYYGDSDTPERAESRIRDLKENVGVFVNTGLKTVRLELEYEYGLPLDEEWQIVIALPEPAITRQKQIAAVKKAFEHYYTSICNETNTATIRASTNLVHTLRRVTNLFNSRLKFFAEQYNLPKARRIQMRDGKKLFNAIRELAAPIARGSTWDRPARTIKSYKPHTTVLTNAHTPETDNQIRCEGLEGMVTRIAVNLNPLNVEIDEETTISRVRSNKIILHNLDTQCQP